VPAHSKKTQSDVDKVVASAPRVGPMRGEISKAVKKAFERLPQFAETEAFGALRGGLLFRWETSPKTTCFIFLKETEVD